MKKYNIHFNGGYPYIVVIKNNNVEIYKNAKELVLVNTYTPIKIFIGKSKKCPTTESSGGYGKEFDGNTILLQLTKFKYLLITNKLLPFTFKKQIIDFESPLGNSDVPYPYAKDIDGNYFIFDERKFIENNKYTKKLIKVFDNDVIEMNYVLQSMCK